MTRWFALCWIALFVSTEAYAQEFRQALSKGQKLIGDGKLEEARTALEAALELAETDREKIDAHYFLMVPYRELKEIEPLQRSAEFIISKSEALTDHTSVRGVLLTFINNRGKMDGAIEQYEARLKKDADDRIALFLLTDAYGTYKREPKLSAEYGEKLIALETKLKIKPYPNAHAEIARQMVLAERFKDAAEIFEKLVPMDEGTEAWYWKEAAQAWLKGDEKVKALAAAKKSALKHEKRTELLTYFWRRGLGDTFLALNEPKLAIPHYEDALKHTKIELYLKETQAKLEDAKRAAKD
jgi:tetratricopeptide (TPR) repeat protein